jgi:hypothetical protein
VADTENPTAREAAAAAPPAAQPSLLVATDGTLPSPDGVRRPRPLVRRRVLFDAAVLEGIFDRVLTRLPGAVSAGVEPLRAELAAARAALDEQARLRMQAEARAVSAERELEFLRAQIAEAAARPAGLFRRRPQPIVVPQA